MVLPYTYLNSNGDLGYLSLAGGKYSLHAVLRSAEMAYIKVIGRIGMT